MTVWTPTYIPIARLPKVDERRRLITGEMLAKLDLGYGDLVEGVFVEMPPPGFEHGFTEMNIGALLKIYSKERGNGRVCGGETGIYTKRDPDTVRGMDAAFISDERFAQNRSKQYIDVAPELVVEVLSPSDRMSVVDDKIEEYFAIGVNIVWIVNPRKKTVRVYTSPTEMVILSGDDLLTAEPHLPDFSTTVSTLFE